jgi:hypothetical protein
MHGRALVVVVGGNECSAKTVELVDVERCEEVG